MRKQAPWIFSLTRQRGPCHLATVLGLLTSLGIAGTVTAQPAEQTPDEPGAARQQVISTFDRRAPKVGEQLGDIELLDSEGNRFDTASFRGRYTVLVFGCLT